MSWIVHDLMCDRCGELDEAVLYERGNPPECRCGGERHWSPAGFNTDLYPTPIYSDASGQYHSSTRDKEAYMRRAGYEPKGDKVRGGRPDLSIRGSAFSYSGQSSRVSTGEKR